MTTYVAALQTMTLTATEKNTVAAAAGYEDAQGMITAVSNALQESLIQLNRLATYVPSGTNLTAINNVITLLQS